MASSSTPGNLPPPTSAASAVWTSRHLMLSVLSFLKGPDKNNLSWTKDVARILRTDNCGLVTAAPVLYESEAAFPHVNSKRFDLVLYLRERGSTEARIKFYTSLVRRLDYYARSLSDKDKEKGGPSADWVDLKLWMNRKLVDYPSASVIHCRVGDTTISAVRNSTGTGFKGMSIFETNYSKAVTVSGDVLDIPTIYNRLCTQITRPKKLVPLTGHTLGKSLAGSSGLSLVAQTCWYGFNLTDTAFQKAAYESLTFLDLRSVQMDWTTLWGFLSRTPKLKRLCGVRILDTEATGAAPDAINQVPNLTFIDITLPLFNYSQLPVFTSHFPLLDRLKVSTSFNPIGMNALPRSVWGGTQHKLPITKLELSGDAMTYAVVLDILSCATSVTKLNISIIRIQQTADLGILQAICRKIPAIEELSILGPALEGFPLMNAIDLLTSQLPSLIYLFITVKIPVDFDANAMTLPIVAETPRWPNLLRLIFRFDWGTPNETKSIPPPCLQIARLLVPCVRRHAELGLILPKLQPDITMHKMEQWWDDVYSTVSLLRQQLVWAEEVVERVPGWRWLEGESGERRVSEDLNEVAEGSEREIAGISSLEPDCAGDNSTGSSDAENDRAEESEKSEDEAAHDDVEED